QRSGASAVPGGGARAGSLLMRGAMFVCREPARPLFLAALVLAAFAGIAVYAQSQDTVEVLRVRGNVSMLAGAGGNIAVQAGNDGVLLVDSGASARVDRVVDAIRSISPRQVTYIVNTTDRADHIGGNAKFALSGRMLAIARAAQARVFIVGFSTML